MTLFDEQTVQWGAARLRLAFEHELPDPALVANVRSLCMVGTDVVLITSEEFGPIALPGGTLEPGESIEDGLAREVMEEVGARVLSHRVIARARFHSEADEPYRPHIPHPIFHWAVGLCDVQIVGPPTMPHGGERISRVDVLPVPDALRILREAGKTWDADLMAYLASVRDV